MAGPVRVRFNTKARGNRPHKKRKLNRKQPDSVFRDDANTDGAVTREADAVEPIVDDILEPGLDIQVLVTKSEAEKEQDRKERLMQEMMAASESKWNKKKKKRLEAYITKKLKKEERLKIFERLVETQAQVDHLQLQSTATLGSGSAHTHAERLAIAEHQEVRRAVQTRDGRRKRPLKGPLLPLPVDDEQTDSSSATDVIMSEAEGSMSTASSVDFDDGEEWAGIQDSSDVGPLADPIVATPAPNLAAKPDIGTGLKRNPDGTVVLPRVVPKRVKPKIGRSKRSGGDSLDDDGLSRSSTSIGSDATQSEEESSSDASRETHSDGSDDEDTESSDSEAARPGQKRKRYGGFKEWAKKQLDAAKDDPPITQQIEEEIPSIPTEYYAHLPEHLKEQARKSAESRKIGPLGEELVLPNTRLAQHVLAQHTDADDCKQYRRHIVVERPDHIEESRMRLPILAEEQGIMETILLNPVVVICGETGSGKTTQVPQFLYEAGFGSPGSENPGMIGITQPRRVAAMSMASRVAQELSLPPNRVSYQIRYDATVSPQTSIKFMTDGVLLRELATDFLLTKYSVIIVDEAHERSMNTDILIGVLSRVLKLREEMWAKNKKGVKPLRLIIMSATLRVSDFAENKTLFLAPPPIVNVEARQFPVTIHYNRRTTHDYVNEVVKKATKIHCRLPPGGILIFLTGQNEIHDVCRKLEKRFGKKYLDEKQRVREEAFGTKNLENKLKNWIQGSADEGIQMEDNNIISARDGVIEADEVEIGTQPDLTIPVGERGDLNQTDALDSDGDSNPESESEQVLIDTDDSDVPMHIVPLYSLLPQDKQMKVFESPPAGTRLVVVATNVAETSLTIPGISYVVDAGRAKQRHYDVLSGIESFRVGWISQASAAQRAGRAGRTGPGHCYRLYSSAFYENHFKQFDEPEVLRMPIEGIVLQMKAMHIDAVVNFPFPTPPDRTALKKAERVLQDLGAVNQPSETSRLLTSGMNSIARYSGQITDLGRSMAFFPVPPRFSKMLVMGRQQGCLPYIIAIVAALSVGDPFLREDAIGQDQEAGIDLNALSHLQSEDVREREARSIMRKAFFKSFALHSNLGSGKSDAFRVLSVVGAYEYEGGTSHFCGEHFVRPKAMEEIHKLRAQLSHIVQANFVDVDGGFTPKLPPPNANQLKAIRQLLAAGFIDRVAVRKAVVDKASADGVKYGSCNNVAYRAMEVDEDVFIHPSSVVYGQSPPDWVVFQDVIRSSRVWIKGITVINPSWLPTLGPSLCTYSKPLDLPPALRKLGAEVKIVTPRFGSQGWILPNVKL